jgi:hypothetical protein
LDVIAGWRCGNVLARSSKRIDHFRLSFRPRRGALLGKQTFNIHNQIWHLLAFIERQYTVATQHSGDAGLLDETIDR